MGGVSTVRRGSKLVRQEHIKATDQPSGYFVLHDSTKGEGVFYINIESCDVQHSIILEQPDPLDEQSTLPSGNDASASTPQEDTSCLDLESPFCTPLSHGVSFIAGQLEFSLIALPLSQVLTLRMFAAARRGDIEELKSIIDSSVAAGVTSPHVVVTPTLNVDVNRYSTVSVVSEEGLDVNVEYEAPSYGDDSVFSYSHGLGRRRSSGSAVRLVVPVSPSSPGLTAHNLPQVHVMHKLLLHIAIQNRDVKMVKFLLEKRADVRT